MRANREAQCLRLAIEVAAQDDTEQTARDDKTVVVTLKVKARCALLFVVAEESVVFDDVRRVGVQ